MEILKKIHVPTGTIYVVQGSKGKLEFLSLGDYGKDVNLNQNREVPDGLRIMPLTEKWVVTTSTQYGCAMNCNFCDVPKAGPGTNATVHDLVRQILIAITDKEEDIPNWTKRLNIHFARMGEASWNPAVLDCGKWIYDHLSTEYSPHPVVSTIMPCKNDWLKTFIHDWMRIKNRLFKGNAGLQISINSTDENERQEMFGGSACTLPEIAEVMKGIIPVGRKITLNFIVSGYTVDTDYLARLFPPELYIIKLTPMHKTHKAQENNLETEGDYTTPEPYQELDRRFRESGFETLVFIASSDEDLSRITCGNAILSGSEPERKTQNK